MTDWLVLVEGVTAVAAVVAAGTAVATRNHVQKIHVEINSRMTQLLANTKELAQAELLAAAQLTADAAVAALKVELAAGKASDKVLSTAEHTASDLES